MAALEATYRFLENQKVDAEEIFRGHVDATVARAAKEAQVYVIHDTTELRKKQQEETLNPRLAY